MSQEVVNIEAGPGDGRFLVEASMRAMPVVAVDPGSELSEAFGGVLVEPDVGPFADGGLDKAFGFAIGAWRVDARADRNSGKGESVTINPLSTQVVNLHVMK